MSLLVTHTSALTQARYFPVDPNGIVMRPGLFKWGTDFGNGVADRRFFQTDPTSARYRSAKARALDAHPERCWLIEEDDSRAALHAVAEWMEAGSARELGVTLDDACTLQRRFLNLAGTLSEDFAILQRQTDGDRLILVHVCFPSGWRPEASVGSSFREIHQGVADMSTSRKASNAMLRAMIEKGPFVRFVWTLCADDELDHHPARYRPRFSDARSFTLRVERQVTIPFSVHEASLFLIRTHLYAVRDLSDTQREQIVRALRNSSEAVLRYKGLYDELPQLIALLQPSPGL